MNLEMDITIVAAVSNNGVIGKDGKIPWSVPSDLKSFKKLTQDGIVIMGRKTFESLGNKPLPKRYNVVVSRTLSKINLHSNLSIVSSLDEALWLAQEDYREAFIIGGSSLYKEAMPLASKMIISHIDTVVKGNTVKFPFISTKAMWREESRIPIDLDSKDECGYSIVTYKKFVESANSSLIGSIAYPSYTTYSSGITITLPSSDTSGSRIKTVPSGDIVTIPSTGWPFSIADITTSTPEEE